MHVKVRMYTNRRRGAYQIFPTLFFETFCVPKLSQLKHIASFDAWNSRHMSNGIHAGITRPVSRPFSATKR